MKIKCIEAYYDLLLKKDIKINDVYEVSAARAKELTTKNNGAKRVLAVVVEEEPAPAPKKRTKSTKKDV